MADAPEPFVADAALRIEKPQARSRAFARKAVAALIAVALEGAVLALVWIERAQTPPQEQEIPIEVVIEPPPPPPPPPQPNPQPSQQEYEKPATDAPREGKSDHDDEHVAEKPKPAKAEPPPPAPSPSPEASKPAQTAAPELPKTAEAEAPTAAPSPDPIPAPPPRVSPLASLPKVFEGVPDVDFGGEAIKSPVTGGDAKSTYLSTLYGLIVPRLHVPAVAHAYGRRLTGAIGLQVDGKGRLLARFVVEGSGSLELDEAAMRAVAEASHQFPPPPKHAPMGMKFTYSVD